MSEITREYATTYIAHGDDAAVAVPVALAAGHAPALHQLAKRLGRFEPAVISHLVDATRLVPFRCVDAEQPHALAGYLKSNSSARR